MKFIQFVFPFLFVRNWVDGSLELSRPRLVIFSAIAVLLIISLAIALILQAPDVYTNGL